MWFILIHVRGSLHFWSMRMQQAFKRPPGRCRVAPVTPSPLRCFRQLVQTFGPLRFVVEYECFGSLQEVMISGVSVWCEGFDLFSRFSRVFLYLIFETFFLWYFLFQAWIRHINTPRFQCSTRLSNDIRYAFLRCLHWRLSWRKVGKTSKWLSKTVKSTCAGRSDGSTNDALKRWILDPRWSKSTEVSTRSQAAVKCQHELKCANIWDWRITFNITKKQVYLSKGHLDQNAGSFIFWLNPFPFQVPIERRYCDYIFNTSVERQRLNIPQLIALFGDKFCKSTWPQKVVQYTSPLLPMTPS